MDTFNRLITMSIEDLTKTYCFLPEDSLLSEQEKDKYSVTAVVLYPVKSCMPFSVKKWPVKNYGLYLDRHWSIYSKGMNKLLVLPRHCTATAIHQFIDIENKLLILASYKMEQNFLLLIDSDGFEKDDSNEFFTVKLESGAQSMQDCGDAVAKWLNEALQMDDLRLLRQTQLRKYELSLAADSHIQLINTLSLEHLATKVAEEQGYFDIDLWTLCLRFRPNVVIDCQNDQEEYKWAKIRINELELECDEPVERCKAINFDFQRFDFGLNPLAYLTKIGGGKALFGVHAFVKDPTAAQSVSVGDKVCVMSLKDAEST